VIDLLRKKEYLTGESQEVDCPDCIDKVFADSTQLMAAVVASNQQKIAFGENSGKKVRRIGKGFGYEQEIALVKGKRCATVNGFSVHANRYVGQQERQKLASLIAYAARPAFSHKYLSLQDPEKPDGDLIYKLKAPWSDGTQAILLTPGELRACYKTTVPAKTTENRVQIR
jgi:hypothetical protein